LVDLAQFQTVPVLQDVFGSSWEHIMPLADALMLTFLVGGFVIFAAALAYGMIVAGGEK
jgi:multisubunit Na+/H+ antiporter MnhC subunit